MARIPRLLPLIAIAIGGVVAVRAVGVAPGLFDGAKAWAEEAAPAVAGAPKPALPGTCAALSPEQLAQQAGISPAELKIIQSLSQRRAALDARDQDFATTLPLMVAAEQKLDAKIQAMTALKAEMRQMLGQVDEREKAEIDRLVQVYSRHAAQGGRPGHGHAGGPGAPARRRRHAPAHPGRHHGPDDGPASPRADREAGRPFPGAADGRPRRRRRSRDPARRRPDARTDPGGRDARRRSDHDAGGQTRRDPGRPADAPPGCDTPGPAPGDPARAPSRRRCDAARRRASGLSALERRQRPAPPDGAVRARRRPRFRLASAPGAAITAPFRDPRPAS
ncbi:MotE family protein [Brevundimonas sp.]|uniref:MotE family protein n=1 Tax=Brevundimonas sp. TaxID=1871086 RepID=UPI003AFFACFC